VVGARWRGDVIAPAQRTILPATPFTEAVTYERASFRLPEGSLWSEQDLAGLEVAYRPLGASALRGEAILPRPRRLPGLSAGAPVWREPDLDSFDFLLVDREARTITILPGSWILDTDLIVPAGYRVHAGAGTRLDLRAGATFLSYSPLELHGSPDEPIVIESTDGSGQGLAVLGAKQKSSLRHVAFRNLRNPAREGWALTGAVTFYESPVEIANAEFSSNDSEDGLNIVRSDFTIDRTLFADTPSDAFDADFSDGAISDSAFVRIGNDGIDVSGSQVRVTRVRVDGAGDKGLSAGERAELTLNDVDVNEAAIGVASKDDSKVAADHLAIRETAVGYAVYRKKPEFGPASMRVKRSSLVGVATPHMVETGSKLELDGRAVDATDDGVYETLYSRG
jgi:hypothetical protein